MVFFLSDKMFIQINNFRKLSLITSESKSLNVKCAHSLVCLNFSFLFFLSEEIGEPGPGEEVSIWWVGGLVGRAGSL